MEAHYYQDGQVEFRASVPGGSMEGTGWDDGSGNRGVAGLVEDADPYDDQCVMAEFYSVGSHGVKAAVHTLRECDGNSEWFNLPTDMAGQLVMTLQILKSDEGDLGPSASAVLP